MEYHQKNNKIIVYIYGELNSLISENVRNRLLYENRKKYPCSVSTNYLVVFCNLSTESLTIKNNTFIVTIRR